MTQLRESTFKEVLAALKATDEQIQVLEDNVASGPETGPPGKLPFRSLRELVIQKTGSDKTERYGITRLPRACQNGYAVISLIKKGDDGEWYIFLVGQKCLAKNKAMISVIEGIIGSNVEKSAIAEVKQETGHEVERVIKTATLDSKPKLVDDGPCHCLVAVAGERASQELEKEEAISEHLIVLPLHRADKTLFEWNQKGIPVNEACFAAIASARWALYYGLL